MYGYGKIGWAIIINAMGSRKGNISWNMVVVMAYLVEQLTTVTLASHTHTNKNIYIYTIIRIIMMKLKLKYPFKSIEKYER